MSRDIHVPPGKNKIVPGPEQEGMSAAGVGRLEGGGERGGRRRKRRELTDEQRQEISEAFALFDSDKDQSLDYHELKVCLNTSLATV